MTSIPLCMLLLVMGMTYVAPAKYNVEVYFIVDEEAVKWYQNRGYTSENSAKNQLKKELYNSMDDVNDMYKTLNNYGLDIQLRISGLKFVSNRIYLDGVIEKKKFITVRNSLITLHRYLNGDKISNSDLIVLITGFDLISSRNRSPLTLGASDVQSICLRQNPALVTEVRGNSGFAYTFAHEVGHALGAEHDQYKNKCNASDGYIMAPISELASKNRWTFSSCTAQHIKNFLKRLDKFRKTCLEETHVKALTPTKKEKDPLDPEKMCKRKLGDKGYMCKIPSFYNGAIKGDSVCRVIWCRSHDTPAGKCMRAFPSEGMVCDAGKRCKQGKCVKAPKNFPAPNIDTDCVYGDTKNQNILTDMAGGCATVIRGNKRKCYEKNIKTQCCASCKKVKTNIRGCEYGDKADGCDPRDLRNSCSGSKRKICCETCRNYRG